MSTDNTRPYLLDALGRIITVDEYLSSELPDKWTADVGAEADETILQSDEIDLFIRIKPDFGEEAIRLCSGPNRSQSELVIQEHFEEFNARNMAYDHALAWTHVIAATIEEAANE